jgi:hypothetical protein
LDSALFFLLSCRFLCSGPFKEILSPFHFLVPFYFLRSLAYLPSNFNVAICCPPATVFHSFSLLTLARFLARSLRPPASSLVSSFALPPSPSPSVFRSPMRRDRPTRLPAQHAVADRYTPWCSWTVTFLTVWAGRHKGSMGTELSSRLTCAGRISRSCPCPRPILAHLSALLRHSILSLFFPPICTLAQTLNFPRAHSLDLHLTYPVPTNAPISVSHFRIKLCPDRARPHCNFTMAAS